jgi:hypothetical protein
LQAMQVCVFVPALFLSFCCVCVVTHLVLT